jgi:uncharacterized membrane protein
MSVVYHCTEETQETNKQTNTSSSFVFLKECNIVCIIGKSKMRRSRRRRRRRRKRSREREFQKAQKKIIHEAQRS